MADCDKERQFLIILTNCLGTSWRVESQFRIKRDLDRIRFITRKLSHLLRVDQFLFTRINLQIGVRTTFYAIVKRRQHAVCYVAAAQRYRQPHTARMRTQ